VGVVGWPVTGRQRGGVLNITVAAWTAGFHWWRSGNITRTQNVSEYMLALALCLVLFRAINSVCHRQIPEFNVLSLLAIHCQPSRSLQLPIGILK